jgi:xanthine dehydrogenase accessory factor
VNRLDSSGDFLVSLYRKIADLLAAGERSALASVLDVSGSVPGRRRMKMLVGRDGEIIGTVGGGALENEVIAVAREVLETGVPRRLRLSLDPSRGKGALGICGGEMEVYVEALGVHTVYLFGGGHVGHAVCAIASQAGFRVEVFDDRPELVTRDRFPAAAELHPGRYRETFARVEGGPFSYLCLVTRGHATDEEVLDLALQGDYRYVGMIGSRSKIDAVFRGLRRKGADEERLGRVHAPIGIEIGAQTPAEIGVSIVAELIREKYRDEPRPGAESGA